MTKTRQWAPSESKGRSLSASPTVPAVVMQRLEPRPQHPHQNLDRAARAAVARLSAGMSSHSFIEDWTDWGQHMSQSPGRQLELIERAQRNAVMLLTHFAEMGGDAVAPFAPKPFDHRFCHPGWQKAPFSLWQQCFLAAQDWWDFATDHLRGLRPEDADRTRFMVRQALDTISPSNFPALNPEIIEATVRSGGRNLVEGAANFARDAIKTVTRINDAAPKGYRIEEGLACTPGQVVFRGEEQRRGDGAHGPRSAGEGYTPIEPSPGTYVLQT